MQLIDTHAHLDDAQFTADLPAVVERAAAAGVEAVLCVGVTAASSEAVVSLVEEYSASPAPNDFGLSTSSNDHRERAIISGVEAPVGRRPCRPVLKAAVGIQPNHAAEATDDDWRQICRLAEHPEVVALGETGLDAYWDFAPLAVQREFFGRHLRLAQQLDQPVVVHCRDCGDAVVAMLTEAAARGPLRGVIHSFSGDRAMADACLELGLYLSFSGMVSYRNKKFEPLRAVAATVPGERLLLETDSPYLTPHPLRGKQPRNEPACIVHTAAALAELRDTTVEALAQQTTQNARQLFAL